jgi:CRP-like cAMP-binding protein
MKQHAVQPVELLGRNALFGTLPPESLSRLAAMATAFELERGARLCQAGDRCDAAYLLVSGLLEITLVQLDGREVVLAELPSGSIIGEIAVLDGGVRSADMVAARKCSLLRLGRDQVLAALEQEPRALLRVAAVLAARLRDTNRLAVESATADVSARLARILLREGQPNTRNQTELARLVSSTRETVNRRLARWRAEGIIDLNHRGIWISDRAALAGLAQADAV